MDADARKGELWVTMDQLKNRVVDMSCLHSKNMYKSVFQRKKIIKTSSFDNNNWIRLDVCKVVVENPTTFMLNLLLYTHEFRAFQLFVTTADDDRRPVKLNYELPDRSYTNSRPKNGQAKIEYYQRFKLQPKAYNFSFWIRLFEDDLKDGDVKLLMKIGSVSECKIEELKCEQKPYWTYLKNCILQ